MNEHVFQSLLVLAGVLLAGIPVGLQRWKRDLIAEGKRKQIEESRDLAITNEAKERGKLEARVDRLKEDIDGVAEMARKRFGKLEKKDTALETFVTGKMPRASGENDAVTSRG